MAKNQGASKNQQDPYLKLNAFNQKSNTGYYYQATDIRIIQREIMCPYSHDVVVHQPIGDAQEINGVLNRLIDRTATGNPVLCVYNLGNWHWVVFSALNVGGKLTVLYKDSKGAHREQLESQIKAIRPTAEFLVHTGV